jgi:SAM-dependent methyltransferase
MPHDAARFFEAIASRYDRVYGLPSSESRLRMARVIAELPRTCNVLDLGVGTGRELTALLDAGHSVTGVDVSPAMLERCRRRARPVPLVQADFWQSLSPFEPGVFDAAIALHGTLAHPPDEGALGRLAAELARLVRIGGRFVAEVPAPVWMERIESLPAAPGRRVRRTGPGRCLFEDLVTGVAIEARTYDAAWWREALLPRWDARVSSLGELEWLIVAERA